MRRFGIFSCFDTEGIIDEYVYYMLEDICENLEELIIVSNGYLDNESMFKLKKYTNHEIVIRDNIGFDAGGWRDVMLDVGFNKLSEYDELILFNDSFFGPIYPFKEMFDEMDKEDVDFWGITNHGEAPNVKDMCPYGYRPRYIQTYFIVFRKNLIKSNEFKKYWRNLPDYGSLTELTFKHEVVLTKFFSDLGYKWKSFVNSDDLEETRNRAMNLYAHDMCNLIVNRRLPVFTIKPFKISRDFHLRYNFDLDLSNTINYLEEHTGYDTSLVYNHLLRKIDPSQLADTLNLVKIIPKNKINTYMTEKKVLLVVDLYYTDLWEYVFNYLKNVPEYIDILITTDSYDKKEFFDENIVCNLDNSVNVITTGDLGRDMAALIVGAKDIIKNYDYFGVIHDKMFQEKEYVTVGATCGDIFWENTLSSSSYISEIIREFDVHPSLGLIVPPKPYHGTFFKEYIKDYWGVNYDETKNLLDQLGIFRELSRQFPPLSIGNCFWAKYDALDLIFNVYLDYDDFVEEPMDDSGTIYHALGRCYGYVAANKGYYTEIVMTDEYAKSEMFNQSYMFSNLINNIKSPSSKYFTYNKGFFGFIRSIKNGFLRIKRASK